MVLVNSLTTTGEQPVTIGSNKTFQLQGWLNGLPWTITSATLLISDPNGVRYSFSGTINSGAGAYVNWVVTGPIGTWLFAWSAQDVNGTTEITDPGPLEVVSSPT